jgi:hypothetical protein
MVNEQRVERRRHKRFKADEGAFASTRVRERKFWQIIDISKGGLAFRYVLSEENAVGSSELDIMTGDVGFSLEKIPYKVISDHKIIDEIPSTKLHLRRRSVQFGTLTPEQASQLEYFIRNHTFKEV